MKLRVAAAVPLVRPGAVKQNLAACLKLAKEADRKGVDVVVFPELCMTGVTCGVVETLDALSLSAMKAYAEFVKKTAALKPVFVVSSVFPQEETNTATRGVAVCMGGETIACSYDGGVVFTLGKVKALVQLGTELTKSKAQLVLNPYSEPELIGAREKRTARLRSIAGVVVSAGAGVGESTASCVYGGAGVVVQDGVVLAEGERFQYRNALVTADVEFGAKAGKLPEVEVEMAVCRPTNPFLPIGEESFAERCAEILTLQSCGLATRLLHTNHSRVVLGVSGGLDSTLALLVAVEAFRKLKLDTAGIICVSMPGFGTTAHTRSNGAKLCKALGLKLRTIDISPACKAHLKAIGHNGRTHDAAYENAQARERTQTLMDLGNHLHALTIGTGDLSEAALGWCTYNGDHMSMYSVNGNVPKSVARAIVAWVAEEQGCKLAEVLQDILATPISPELLPHASGAIHQKTESLIGPYELHDYFLYYFVGKRLLPPLVLESAVDAFNGIYSAQEIAKWLDVFLARFFSQQFKRSCAPDCPQVGTVSLAPGDWRMPSDIDGSLFSLKNWKAQDWCTP